MEAESPLVADPPPATSGGLALQSRLSSSSSSSSSCLHVAPPELKFTDESSAAQRLLRLRLAQEVGSGTYGVIYVARDPITGLQWVAKFPKPMTTQSVPGELESNRGHLRQEFAATSRLEHPKVVRALGLCLGEDGLAPAL